MEWGLVSSRHMEWGLVSRTQGMGVTWNGGWLVGHVESFFSFQFGVMTS